MKNSTLLVLAILGIAAWFLFKDKLMTVQQAPADANPTGGSTVGTNEPDTFQSILGAVTAVFGAIKQVAQTNPSTT